MNHVNAIALNLMSLGLGSLRGLSLGDVALIIAWTLILIVYVAGQALRFPRKRRSKNWQSSSFEVLSATVGNRRSRRLRITTQT
jgi:hypothetical protein